MRRGFTLIELILALAISTVVVSTAISMYLSFMREYSAIQEKQRINNEFMRVEQNIIKQVIEDKSPVAALRKPEANCTINLTTETVGARTLLHVRLSAENRATHEAYNSALLLVVR